MAERQLHPVLRHVRHLAAAAYPGDLPDRELLGRFVARRDEEAFAALVRRHGAMVLGVCRGVLGHRQDAEDACQAAFLVLARKAASVRKREAVASWLYGVACRVARKLRAQVSRRAARTGTDVDVPQPDVTDGVTWAEVRVILHEELDRLPAAYRAPLVLCYLEGKTQDEAARQLGWGRTTLRGRLERGRHRLRARLLRRGVTLSAALCGAALGDSRLSAGLAASTVRAATEAAGVVSPRVAALAEGVLSVPFATRLKLAAGLLLAAGVVLGGVGTLANPLSATNPPGPGGAGQPPPADRQPSPAWIPPLQPGVLEQTQGVAAGRDAGTVRPGAPVFTFPVGGQDIKAAVDGRRAEKGDGWPAVVRFDFGPGPGKFADGPAVPLRVVRTPDAVGDFDAEFGPATFTVEREGRRVPLTVQGWHGIHAGGLGVELNLVVSTQVEAPCRFGDRRYAVRVVDGNGNLRLGDGAEVALDGGKLKGLDRRRGVRGRCGDTVAIDTGAGDFRDAKAVLRCFYGQPVRVGGAWYRVELSRDGAGLSATPVRVDAARVRADRDAWSATLVGTKYVVEVAGGREPVALPADRYAVVRLAVPEQDAVGGWAERVVYEHDPGRPPRVIEVPAGAVTELSPDFWRR